MATELDAVEKLRRMADTLGEGSGFFLQRSDDGTYGAGVGGAFGNVFDVRDVPTLDEAIEGVARQILSDAWTRLNTLRHSEEPRLLRTVGALGRLGYK